MEDSKINPAEEVLTEARPAGKPVARLRGIMEKYENESLVFLPSQRGSGRKPTPIKRGKNYSYVKHEGEKTSSYTYSINIPAETVDPAAEIIEQTAKNLKDKTTREPQLPATAKYLHETENVKIWKSAKRRKVCILVEFGDDLTKAKFLSEFWKQMTDVNKIITNSKIL